MIDHFSPCVRPWLAAHGKSPLKIVERINSLKLIPCQKNDKLEEFYDLEVTGLALDTKWVHITGQLVINRTMVGSQVK